MRSAKGIATIAIMTATLSAGKLVMSFLPNIEPVTILIALYSTVFGLGFSLPATIVFVLLDVLIYGFGTWVPLYFIYWPLVALIFGLTKHSPLWAKVLTAFTLTLFFGVLSSLIDVGLFMGAFDDFWYRFGVMYLRGIPFYILHLSSNVVLFALCFNPLKNALDKIKTNLAV